MKILHISCEWYHSQHERTRNVGVLCQLQVHAQSEILTGQAEHLRSCERWGLAYRWSTRWWSLVRYFMYLNVDTPHADLSSTRRHSCDTCSRPSPFSSLFYFHILYWMQTKKQGQGRRGEATPHSKTFYSPMHKVILWINVTILVAELKVTNWITLYCLSTVCVS